MRLKTHKAGTARNPKCTRHPNEHPDESHAKAQRRSSHRSRPEGALNKTRKNGAVVEVMRTLVFGSLALLDLYLSRSKVSLTLNTSFVERNNATDRNQNGRKVRKAYTFSKDWDVHNAMSYFVGFSYNFCWPVRSLQIKAEGGKRHDRTPAMAAGLADHVWTIEEWVTFPEKPG